MSRFADVKAAAVLTAAGVLSRTTLLALYTLATRRQMTAAWSQHCHDNVVQRYSDDREAFASAWLEAAADWARSSGRPAGQIRVANMMAYRRFTRITWSVRALVVGSWLLRPWPSPEMLLVLMVAFAAVALISFLGGDRAPNRTIWIVVGAFLLVGLLFVVGAHAG
ncbi:MAG TPA: hypothetical protein VFM54_21065 [Micromonosporaceae bacterium]|nr:hypothetical protein [Micromonosporaceae bacterium]